MLAAIQSADTGGGVVVLYDLGSALLTAETALDLLDDDVRERVGIADGPLVEGAIAAGVEAQGGGDLAAVLAAGESAGGGGGSAEAAPPGGESADDTVRATTALVNKVGLHARPAGALVRALADLNADLTVGRPGDPGVNARSVLSVIGLGLDNGQEVEYTANGPDAQQALDTAVELTRERFGDPE